MQLVRKDWDENETLACTGVCNSPVKSRVLHIELLQLNFCRCFKLRERNHNRDCVLGCTFSAGKLNTAELVQVIRAAVDGSVAAGFNKP